MILSGLPEAPDEDNDLTKNKACDLLNDLVNGTVILSATRVGKKHDERPRKIKIVTNSQHQRNTLLKNAPKLKSRRVDGLPLYLDRDRPLLDRKEASRLRARLKQLRKEMPKSEVKILRGRLLVDDKVVDSEEPLRHTLPFLDRQLQESQTI